MSPETYQAIHEMKLLGARQNRAAHRQLIRRVDAVRADLGLPSRAEESRAQWQALQLHFREFGVAARRAGLALVGMKKAMDTAQQIEFEQRAKHLGALIEQGVIHVPTPFEPPR